MGRHIIVNNRSVAYTLRKSSRARRMRLAVYCDGSITVTLPYGYQESVAERFILEKTNWLISKIAFFGQFKNKPVSRNSRADYMKYKDQAREAVNQIITQFSTEHGFQYKNINIKNQKTCWGSCSRKLNLNFNYKILFLPRKVQEYIVVHELCHLKEFNHSRKFWNWVEKVIPDYGQIKSELRTSGVRYL